MKNEDNEVSTKRHKSGKFRLLKWFLVGLAGLLLLFFFVTPLYLSSSGGTKMLLGKINRSVDGQVQMEDFSIGWFKGVELTNLSYDDSAGNTSVTVRRIETQPKYVSLLGGKVKLGKTVVEGPQVYLKVTQEKEQPATSGPATDVELPAEPKPMLPIEQIDLQLIDGAATIELVGDVMQTVQFANIASKVQIAEAGKPSVIDLSMDVDDSSTITAKGTATPAKKGWSLKDGDFEVQISKLQLSSLKPLFALAGKEMDMAGELNVDAAFKIAGNQVQQLKADAVVTDFAQGAGEQRTVFEKPVTISALTSAEGDAVKIEKLNVQSGFCTVDCTGTTENLSYEIKADDLEQTQRFAGQFVDMQGLAMQGNLSMQGQVHLADDRIGITGAGSSEGLVVTKDGVQTPTTDAAIKFDCTVDKAAERLQLDSANVTATPGTVQVTNLVLPLSKEAAKTVSADVQAKVDLAKTWPFVQVFTELPKDVQVSGLLDSAVKVSTEAKQIRLLTDKTQITQLKVTRPDSDPFRQEKVSLNADIILDTDNQMIDIRKLDMQAAEGQSLIKISKGKVEKKISQNTTKLSGEFEAQYDLQTVSAFASAYIPEGLSMEGQRNDLLHFESQYPTAQPELMKTNLNAGGTFGFEKAAFNGLNFGPTDIAIKVNGGVVDLNIPETTVNEGKFRFSGNVNLNEEPLTLRLMQPTQVIENIHLNDELTQKMLTYLNPIFAEQSNVSGYTSLKCDRLEIPFSSAHKNNIVLDATVSMDKVRLKAVGLVGQILAQTSNRSEFDARLLPSKIELKNGIMQYDRMEFHLDNYPVGFSGKIYLNKSMDMKVALPYRLDEGGTKIRSIKIGEDLNRRLELAIEGPVDNAQIRLDKLFESVLQNLIQQGLGDILKNL